jgi:hypothetical protein
LPVDSLHPVNSANVEFVRKRYAQFRWNEIYDFLEFIASIELSGSAREGFTDACNSMMEREQSGYRFIDDLIAPVTSSEEIEEIAAAESGPLSTINEHIRQALSNLSDRAEPNYRNSIKESISAVEAVCKHISKKEKADLSMAMAAIEEHYHAHPALKQAFTKLYAYTCDADGIRHALMEESNLEFEDAKFMLVACSAFVNYLLAKKAKIDRAR